jgi:hypothetical protein
MAEKPRHPESDSTREGYAKPDLVVHGTVESVTRGSTQGVPDGTAPGSSLP